MWGYVWEVCDYVSNWMNECKRGMWRSVCDVCECLEERKYGRYVSEWVIDWLEGKVLECVSKCER